MNIDNTVVYVPISKAGISTKEFVGITSGHSEICPAAI